jgi:hypothetical protein
MHEEPTTDQDGQGNDDRERYSGLATRAEPGAAADDVASSCT